MSAEVLATTHLDRLRAALGDAETGDSATVYVSRADLRWALGRISEGMIVASRKQQSGRRAPAGISEAQLASARAMRVTATLCEVAPDAGEDWRPYTLNIEQVESRHYIYVIERRGIEVGVGMANLDFDTAVAQGRFAVRELVARGQR